MKFHSCTVFVQCLVLVGSFGVPRLVNAQQSDAQSPAVQAEALIERGLAARLRGDDDVALASFRQAVTLNATPRGHAQVALAEQALGQWSDAERDLQQALTAQTDPWIQRNLAALQQAMVALQSRLATLDVRTDRPGVQVRINERTVATTPLTQPLRVAAGTVIIDVVGDNYVPQRRTVELAARANSREVFTMVERNTQPTGAGATVQVTPAGSQTSSSVSSSGSLAVPPLSARPSQGIAWVGPTIVGASGAAVLLSSIAFAALRNTSLNGCPYDDAQMGLVCATPAAYETASQGPGWSTAINVTLIGGSALLVGGGVWLAVNAATMPSSERARASVTRRWTVPVATQNGAMLMTGGTW